MSNWTPDSLRPPTPEDAPFYAMDFGIVIAGDGVVHPLPKTTQHLDNAVRRFTELPLREELSRLCSLFNEEALSAIANALRQTVAGHVKRQRPRSERSAHPAAEIAKPAELFPVPTQQFESAVKKYPELPLRDELEQLCRNLPAEALSALGDALRQTVASQVKRGPPRIHGLSSPPAHIRAAVQARRRQGFSDVQIARDIEHLFPRVRAQSDSSRRTWARREVRKVPASSSKGVKVNLAVAIVSWATLRAERQLNVAVHRGLLTFEEAEQLRESRISRIKSRAEGEQRP